MRRRLLITLIAAAATLLALAAALAWLTLTQPGLDRAVALLQSLESVDIRIEGARGRLAGPLAIERFELRHARVDVLAVGVVADYEPSSLAWGSIGADSLAARRVEVHVKPKDRRDDRPPRFLPAWLSLAIDAIDVPQAEVTLPNGVRLPLSGVHGSLRMNSTRLEARALSVDGGTWSARGAATLVARSPLGLGGDLQFTAGRGREVRGHVLGEGDLMALPVSGSLAAPLAATFAGRLLALTEAPRWQARFDVTRLDAGRLARHAPLGTLAGRLDGHGTFRDYTLQGALAGPGLPSPGAKVAAHAQLGTDHLQLDPVEVTLPATDTRIVLTGRIGLAGDAPLALVAEWQHLPWPLTGATRLTSRSGRLELDGGPHYRFALDAAATPRKLPEVQAIASGTLDAAALVLAHADLAGLGGNGSASGRLGFATRDWQLQAELRDLDPGRLRRDLSGRVSAVLSGSGSGFDQAARWQVELHSLGGRFRGQPLAGRALVTHRPGATVFERTRLTLGPAALTLDGRFGEDTELDGRLVADDLSRLLPELGGSLRVELQARSQGPRRATGPALRLQAALTGTDLRWHDYRAARIGVDADIDLADEDTSWLRVRTIGVDLAGRALATTRLSLDGTSRDHGVVLRVGVGDDAVELLGRGSLRWPDYGLHVTALEGRGPHLPDYALLGPFDLSARPDGASLTPVCLARGGQRLCVHGGWSRSAPWQAALSAEALPLDLLALDLPGKPAYRGRLDLQAAVAGAPGRDWAASGIATVSDARFSYRRASGRDESLSLGAARIDLAMTPTLYLARLQSQATATTFVDAEVTAPRQPGTPFASLPLSGHVRALSRELALVPLFVPDIDRAAGELRTELALAGTLGAPLASGEIALSGGELDFYQSNLRLRAIEASARLSGNQLTLATAADAGKGHFTLGGTLAWVDRQLSGDLALRGERLLVADLPEARVLASPDLRVRFDGAHAQVSGSVRVPEARIAPATITGAVLASGDERIVDAGTPATPRRPYTLQGRLTLTLGNAVTLDAFGLEGRLTGSVTASVGSDAVATGTGEFKVEDGKYSAYTRELDVERGRLLFAGGPLADPGVDLRAQRKFPGYTAGVNVRGRLRRPEITFFSDPPLSQSEIASLLLVGRRLDNLGADDTGQFSMNRDQLVTQGGALLAGQLGRYVGLDDVSVETGADDYASLVLGKFLSPRLYVSYGISLAEQINTLKLRYTIGDRWLLRLETGAESSVDAEYTIER